MKKQTQNQKANAKPMHHPQTRLDLTRTPPKRKPWDDAVNSSSSFETIMNEQTKPTHHYIYGDVPSMADQDLLEQQMILQSIIESTKQSQNEASPPKQKDEDEQKQPTTDATNANGQAISDEMLAIYLQQQEQQKLLRNQKRSQMHDGKYAKVTSSSAHTTAIPKAALKFYYDDESMMNGNALTKHKEQTQSKSTNENTIETVEEGMSKHDPKIWSEMHMNRLNEYEAGGNLNTDMHIGNQAYNSFRNQLDKKGFISYHNYRLEPNAKKR
eukprot:68017_1